MGFEDWYRKNISESYIKALFNESCLCYKIGAFRASFLMTYLGFQNVLKERILKATLPNGFTQEHWDTILNKVKDDDLWDSEVFDLVIRTKPNNPFLIKDDIRTQYGYFRCIRNDCAHAKSNTIDYSHVDTLRLFIQSNYNKFIINGGEKGLLERIKKHYNPKYTKPYSDVTPIVENITSSMDRIEIQNFLKDVYDLFYSIFKIKSSFSKDELGNDFWEAIIYSTSEELKDEMYNFVRSDWEIFINFLDSHPDKAVEILEDSTEEFKREFWNDNIFILFLWAYTNEWNILETIIKNKIVPEDEVNVLVHKLIKFTFVLPPNEKVGFLKEIGYFEELKQDVFESGRKFSYPYGIEYVNKNWEKIKLILLNTELDKNIASQLNAVFQQTTYGTFFEGFTKFLEDNKEFKKKFDEIKGP